MPSPKRKSSEQPAFWGLPDRVQPDIRKGGSVLTITLSPELTKALHERADEVIIDRLVLRILHEWADVPEPSTNAPDNGTFQAETPPAGKDPSG